jgi:phage shock protein A
MSTVSERDFGRLEATVEKLEDQVEKLTAAVERLATTVDQAKGGWRVLAAVGAAASVATTFAIKFLGLLKGY